MTTAVASPAPRADVTNRIPITGALMLATLMNTLDSTIANVALPHMKGSLGASQDQITWVLTSYIIATAIMTPLSGWLSQKIGRKTMLLACIVGFTVASALCGVAQTLPEMVLFRFLQGIAGAGLMPLSQTVMLDIYPQRLIPQVMSVWSAAVIMGPILGPAVGGWITENASWRWCFYINVPIGGLAIFALMTFMADDPGGRQRPFDFLGFGALAVFVGSFQLMMDRGPDQDWFGSPEIVIEAVVAALGFWIFLIQTLTAEHPFFHRDLAKDRNFVSCTLFGFCVGGILFSTTAILPSFMQNLLGYSALQSGYASMPRGLGSLIAFLLMPMLISRIGARRTLVIGIVLCIAALWSMSHFNLEMTSRLIVTSGLVQGLGVGMLFSPLNVLSYATLNPVHRTEGTVVATMIRSLGSSVGISVIQASLSNNAAVVHARLGADITASNPAVAAALPAGVSPATPMGAALLNGELTRQATMVGYVDVFAWMAVMTLLLVPLLLIMRPMPQMQTVPLDAAAE
jgi:DHA2 family multidrug resistance protein